MKYRLKFSKNGSASYISHLDLMRTFQRAFSRAGIALKRSEGFNPHPLLFIALPLSVGQESVCELLDFETLYPLDAPAAIDALSFALPDGIEALRITAAGAKFAKIKWISVIGTFFYDNTPPENILARLREYFAAEKLIIRKKTKRGEGNFDIQGAYRDLRFSTDGVSVTLSARVSAQNPTMNPALFIDALASSDGLLPDAARFIRTDLFDELLAPFN
ncbi:MAG: TIGR03936 family radical SAM-associated protein [Oscillospiraceae bacterium]|jgi:radical SAM-linked protein|nr:TIGR03936 family radical SAM-associated protein [Oscillospiraceae bacterium]